MERAEHFGTGFFGCTEPPIVAPTAFQPGGYPQQTPDNPSQDGRKAGPHRTSGLWSKLSHCTVSSRLAPALYPYGEGAELPTLTRLAA